MNTSNASRYAAFISYSHQDESHASWLHRALENYRPPKGVSLAPSSAQFLPRTDRLAPVFRDREELRAGADLPVLIEDALRQSGALVVICSPHAAQSTWVNKEIRRYRELHGDARLFAIIVDGDPADDVSCFPAALLEKTGPDGEVISGAVEPLAADIRDNKDGKALAKLKLAAGLMNVGLDDLTRREQARERKRMARWVAGLATVAVVSISLAIFALLSRQEAVRQRERAETEAMTAERTADFMIDLFEVADPRVTTNITAREILKNGVASVETELEDEPAVQADLMRSMGRAYTGLGLYDDAAALLQKAYDRKMEIEAEPMDVFETETSLASALYEKGDFETSGELYKRLVERIDGMADAIGWRPVMADALAGLGDVQSRNLAFAEAEAQFRKAVDRLEDAGMTDTEEYARALMGLGLSLVDQERFEVAEEILSRGMALAKRLKGDQHYAIGIFENALANSYYFAGDIEKAAVHFEKDLAISRINLEEDHPELAIGMNNLGRIEFELGNIDKAYQLLSEAVAIQRQTGRDQHVDFSFLLYTLGELNIERAEYNRALALFDEALNLIGEADHRLRAPLKLTKGRAFCAIGEWEAGAATVRAARSELSAHYEEGDWRYGVADEFESKCLAEAGDQSGARALAASGAEILQTARGPDHYFTRRATKWAESLN